MAINDGLRFTIPNVQFRRTLGIVSYPVLDSMQGNFYLGGSVDASARNQGPTGPDAEERGIVDVSNPHFLRVRGLAEQAFVTGIVDSTNDLTIICVVRNDEMPAVITGNVSSSEPRDGTFGLSLDNLGRHQFMVSNAASAISVHVAETRPQRWVFLAGVVTGTAVAAWYGMDGTLKKTAAPGAFTRTRSPIPVSIAQGASNFTASNYRDFSIAQMSLHATALPDARIATIYRFLRGFYARVGIAI